MTLKLDQVFICTGFWKLYQGVSIGGGIGSISDILDASQMIIENRLRRLSPYFIPKILINMASGHVSMRYGFQLVRPVLTLLVMLHG